MAYSDDISGAPNLFAGGDWDNLSATDQPGEPGNVAASGNNVWQKVFLTAGSYVFGHDTTPAGDTVMTIYSGPPDAGYADLTYITSGDDQGGNLKPKITYTLPADSWIYIESTGYGGTRVSGQISYVVAAPPPPVGADGWIDCSDRLGYLRGWAADLGVYTGPWPMMWPPSLNPDGFGGEVDFIVMLPSPAHPADVRLVGDGTYDSYVYATYFDGFAWSDGGWWTDGVGTLNDSPLPPVLPTGAHLYVQVFNSSDSPPTVLPQSLVPLSYGGTNPNEWTPGEWSPVTEPASDVAGTLPSSLSGVDPAVSVAKSLPGYTNSAAWAGMTGLTVSTLPFPYVDLHSTEAALATDLAALRGTSSTYSGGMLHSWSSKHAYDPGDGEGIKALDPPSSSMQLGQCHRVESVGFDPVNTLPPFFNDHYGSVWANEPWGDYHARADTWIPSVPPTVTFDDMPAVVLNTGTAFDYQGPLPPNPPPQTINVYARQATYPPVSDPALGYPGTIQETAGLQLIGSFTVSLDFATSSVSAPATIPLDLSTVPLTSDGSVYWSIEVILEPAAWSSPDIIDVAQPDAGSLGNNSELTYSSHYGFDCNVETPFPWTMHFPSFRYWVPGQLVASPAPCPPGTITVTTVIPGHWSDWQDEAPFTADATSVTHQYSGRGNARGGGDPAVPPAGNAYTPGLVGDPVGIARGQYGAAVAGTSYDSSEYRTDSSPTGGIYGDGPAAAAYAQLDIDANFSTVGGNHYYTDIQMFTQAYAAEFGYTPPAGPPSGFAETGARFWERDPGGSVVWSWDTWAATIVARSQASASPAASYDGGDGAQIVLLGDTSLSTLWDMGSRGGVLWEQDGLGASFTTYTPTIDLSALPAAPLIVAGRLVSQATPSALTLIPTGDPHAGGVYQSEAISQFRVTAGIPQVRVQMPRWRYWIPETVTVTCVPIATTVTVDSPLRLTQRDDGMGTQGHARMRIGPNGPSSTQWQRAPRAGDNNRYS